VVGDGEEATHVIEVSVGEDHGVEAADAEAAQGGDDHVLTGVTSDKGAASVDEDRLSGGRLDERGVALADGDKCDAELIARRLIYQNN
jgi:hypothetical protein